MRRMTLAILFSAGLWAMPVSSAAAQAITEREAHAIAVDAYPYLYPLVTMDVTRRQSTNVEPGKEIGGGPMNAFTSVREYPPADFQECYARKL